jgi:hypothetical protein
VVSDQAAGATATKLSGDAGRNHVRGSVQKWEFCVQVVAADRLAKSTSSKISIQAGVGGQCTRILIQNDRAMVDVMVSGTAGGYPPAWLC